MAASGPVAAPHGVPAEPGSQQAEEQAQFEVWFLNHNLYGSRRR